MFTGCCSRQDFLNFSWIVPPPSYPQPQREADDVLERGTAQWKSFQAIKPGGVIQVHTESVFAVPHSAGPCRTRQREHSVKDQPGTWEGEGGADTDLACSTSWSVAADAPSSGSSCATALQLPPSASCCLQTCQQISLCMCSFARSRHHQPGSLGPCFPCPSRWEGSSSSPGSGGQQLGMGPPSGDPGKHFGPRVRVPWISDLHEGC